jgi:hypothetical protein
MYPSNVTESMRRQSVIGGRCRSRTACGIISLVVLGGAGRFCYRSCYRPLEPTLVSRVCPSGEQVQVWWRPSAYLVSSNRWLASLKLSTATPTYRVCSPPPEGGSSRSHTSRPGRPFP